MSQIKLSSCALNQTPLDWKNNVANIQWAIAEAEKDGSDLLCLPELCLSSYGCQDMFFHDWVAETAWQELLKLIPLSENIYFTLGLPFWFQDECFNGIAILGKGQLLGISLKQSLPDDGIYYEPRWFKPWQRGRIETVEKDGITFPIGEVIYNVKSLRVGLEICEDAWRQDRPAISLAKRGIDIILNPSASHFEFNKAQFRENLMLNSAKKFKAVYVYANQLGNESGRTIYEGDALIVSPDAVISKSDLLGFKRAQYISAILDFKEGEMIGKGSLITYESDKNQQFLAATSLALFDYLRKSGSKCFVLSLSGGADSGCCAVLVSSMVKKALATLGKKEAAKRLGRLDLLEIPEAEWVSKVLICVYQSTENSSETTRNAAKTLAEDLGATFYIWSVQEEINSGLKKIENSLGKNLTWESDDIALQNIQARMRSPFVWVLANSLNGLLITTSNRSEGDVGYTTMDGDTSGSLAPLAGIDKPFIRQWLIWAEKSLPCPALALINAQQPTAELRPGTNSQSDEEDLMPYSIMLQIERLFLKNRLSPTKIIEELVAKEVDHEKAMVFVERFFKLWSRNQWKRERLAPSFHLDDFNIDPKTWMRFPILNGGFLNDIEEYKVSKIKFEK